MAVHGLAVWITDVFSRWRFSAKASGQTGFGTHGPARQTHIPVVLKHENISRLDGSTSGRCQRRGSTTSTQCSAESSRA